jgi:hypothetical protein
MLPAESVGQPDILSELFEQAANLKWKINSVTELKTGELREKVRKAKELWVDYKPESLDATVWAVDSGWNYRLYPGFYVYALKAAAVDVGMRINHSVAEVDMLSGDPYNAMLLPELALKYIAEGYEHEIALEASDDSDLVLVDGSLIARLEDIMNRQQQRLRIEYMAHLKPLIGTENIAFISKYSHDRSLIGGSLGDIYYINMAAGGVGYTRPFTITRHEWTFSVFYVRLSNDANALHVEVPSIIGEGFVERFIDALSETAVRGYPYQLMIAHKVANLSDELMDMLCKAAGLTGFQEARGVLNV